MTYISRLLKTLCLKGETEMKIKSQFVSKVHILVCLLVVFLLAACGSTQPVQEVGQDDPAEVDLPAPPLEEAQPEEQTQMDPPTEGQSAPPSDYVVWMEDLLYPGAEFLMEVDGFGGPMTPWRFYAVPNATGQQVAEYYQQQLNWFVVENDEIIDGIRYLMLAHPEPMAFMNNVEGFEEMQEISQTMDGSLLGVEVTHSDVGAGLNRLGMAIDMHGIADQIPPNTTIIVLEYFQNVY
jgi:hypothetical protein